MNLQKTINKFATPEEPAHLKDRLSDLNKMNAYGPDNIPFVVVAMNHKEAEGLFDGKEAIFHHHQNARVAEEQTTRFQKFKQVFHQLFPVDARDTWCQQYKDVREEWTPDSCTDSIMAQIELEALNIFQRTAPPDDNPAPDRPFQFFWPDFQSGDSGLFADDANTRLQSWGRLHLNHESVLVIDGISLFHPFIREVLEASPLGWRNAYTGVLVLFPMNVPLQDLRKHLEQEIQAEMRVAFARFDEHAHPLFAFDVNTERQLRHWLKQGIAGLISQKTGADPENLEQVTAQGHGMTPNPGGGPG